MANKGRELADKRLKELERELSRRYASEQDKIQRKIKRRLLKFNVQDKSRRFLVDNGFMKQEDYESWRRAELTHGRSVNKLIDELAEEMLDVNRHSAERINKANERIYQDSYRHSAKDGGIKADKKKRGLFRRANIDEQKDLRWNKQKLVSMLMQSVKRGEDVDQIAKRLAGILPMNRNSAIRSARTAATSAENSAMLDSFYEMRAAGIPVKKMWVTIIDERTRASHVKLNGEVRELEERFSNGLLYPGDPDGDAKEIFNCRCRLDKSIAPVE